MEVDIPTASQAQSLLSTFEGYRAHLDDYVGIPPHPVSSRQTSADAHRCPSQNERRERLIILNRGITSLSKKLIFHLHRVSLLPASQPTSAEALDGDAPASGPSKTPREQWLDEAEVKRSEIMEWWLKVRDELRQVADAARGLSTEVEAKEEENGAIDGAYWAYARNV